MPGASPASDGGARQVWIDCDASSTGAVRGSSLARRIVGSPALIGLLTVLTTVSHGLAEDRPAQSSVREEGRALFEIYCFDCHAAGIRKGGLELDRLLDGNHSDADRAEWESIWKVVRHEFMPPATTELPTDEERRTINRWIEQQVFHVDESRPDPGRVTIRRLNRMEYHYTVRDLFGIDLDLAKELPPDDTAFGFDNIGDAQTLSPALLETYLNLAEKIVGNVIVTDGPRHPRIDLGPPKFTVKKPPTDEDLRVEQAASVDLRHEGRYSVEVQFRLGGFRAFGGDYEFQMSLGGKELVKQVVSDGGEKTYVLSGETTLPAGTHELLLSTLPVNVGKAKPKPLTLFPRAAIVGPIGTGIYEDPEPHRRVFFQGPAPQDAEARRAYAKAILSRIADRAFRRPAGEATVNRLVTIALESEAFETGIARAVTAILSSPRFYFRAELQPFPDEPKEIYPLDDYALASRLSYLLWLSPPDEELFALASQGKVRENLQTQLRRMLADPKSERFFEDFAGQWLRTRNILLTPISNRNQGAIDPYRGLLKRETEMLFEHIARQDRDLTELLTADYTFLNERLARYYGIEGVTGDEMRQVPLPADSHRSGILTHGGLLISTSNPNRTSPVKRGVFILENLLGKEVPPPPPNVGNLEDTRRDKREPKTLREQLAIHREQASCASCHNHFDPIGLALENYDNAGRWRTKEFGTPIDATTTLVTGESIDGAAALSKALASHREGFYRCVTEKLLTYALGRGLGPTDAVTVDRIIGRLASDGGKFSTLLSSVVESEPFQMRRGDPGETRSMGQTARREPPPPEKRGAVGRSMVATVKRQREVQKAQNAESGLVPEQEAVGAGSSSPPASPETSTSTSTQRGSTP